MAGRLLRGECLFHPGDAGAWGHDEATLPSKIQRLVYSGSTRRSEVKQKVPGKTHEWVHQRKVTAYILTGAQWRRVAPLVPLRANLTDHQRRIQLEQHRKAIAGMLYVLYRGTSWEHLPQRYWYYGQMKTRSGGHAVYGAWFSWKKRGLWLDMLRAAGVVNEGDQIVWHKLQRITVMAE